MSVYITRALTLQYIQLYEDVILVRLADLTYKIDNMLKMGLQKPLPYFTFGLKEEQGV